MLRGGPLTRLFSLTDVDMLRAMTFDLSSMVWHRALLCSKGSCKWNVGSPERTSLGVEPPPPSEWPNRTVDRGLGS